MVSDNVETLPAGDKASYELLEDVLAREKANRQRAYSTGLSLGGKGLIVMAETYAETFAALFIHAAWAGSPNSDTVLGTAFNWAGLKQFMDGVFR